MLPNPSHRPLPWPPANAWPGASVPGWPGLSPRWTWPPLQPPAGAEAAPAPAAGPDLPPPGGGEERPAEAAPAAALPEAAGIPPAGPRRGGLPLAELLSRRIRGFSERLLTEHHRLYREHYAKFREIRTKLRTAERAEAHPVFSRYRALKVAEAVAWNGIRLHELYFDHLGGAGGPPAGRIGELIKRDFGSYEGWTRDLAAAAGSTRQWAVTAWDVYDRRLHNRSMTKA